MKIFFNMELGKYCNLSNVIIVIHIFVLCPFYIFILKAIKFTICKKKKPRFWPVFLCQPKVFLRKCSINCSIKYFRPFHLQFPPNYVKYCLILQIELL